MKKLALSAVFLILCSAAAVHADASFTGTWDTNYGPLTMVQKGRKVTGSYCDGTANLQGKVEGHRLNLNYQEPHEGGEACFDLAGDGNSFIGRYRTAGSNQWVEWSGTRK
jgi:opacity protein-like surface antigen